MFVSVADSCPYAIVRDALGKAMRQQLLDFALQKEPNFRTGRTYNRRTGAAGENPDRRRCLVADLPANLHREVANNAMPLLTKIVRSLAIDEDALDIREVELSSYGDGDRFAIHIDTQERLTEVRILSCIYYLSPKGSFDGGNLRLYGFPTSLESTGAESHVDIEPEPGLLVAFPSWMRHEVLPVRARDGWPNRRFAVNIWMHRRQAQES